MIDRERLLETFLSLARISSPSGSEQAVAAAIRTVLTELGIETRFDAAGNLIAFLEGEGEPLLLTAHMDTVGPCEHVQPEVRDGVVYSDGTSILGADDKSGVAAILEVARVLKERDLPHRPLDLVFTVQEETGLTGAKLLDASLLRARMGIGLDAGGEIGTIVVSAPSQNSLVATIHGRSAHAGVNPEAGINAIRVAAQALLEMPLGRIDEETTANIGTIAGGTATNIVPDQVVLRGEARSRSQEKLARQTAAMVDALQRSAQASGATVDLEVSDMYQAYVLDAQTPVVRLVSETMGSLGVTPQLMPTGGGSDANVLNAGGIATVQLSTGMAAVHTLQEHIVVDDMLLAARIVLASVTAS